MDEADDDDPPLGVELFELDGVVLDVELSAFGDADELPDAVVEVDCP